ncbi:MAG: acyl--CoA ligase [Oscillospiraceae bacterium]|jgi:long-chain acyl-CoA synthetase|nr:acyl--CoA ligase [Oscillospiraceae bacterium]
MIRTLLLNREHWAKTAVLDGENTISYGDLAARAFSLCIRLTLPQAAGSHTAILLPDGGDYIAALFGALMAGTTAFPLNATLTRHEIEALLSQTGTRRVVTSAAFRPLWDGMADPPEALYMEELPPWTNGPFPERVWADANECMLLLATSGTTGKAKIVMLSERNVESSVTDNLCRIDYGNCNEEDIRYLLGTPLSSVYGLHILFLLLRRGFTLVAAPAHFSPDTFFGTIARCRVTHFEGGAIAAALMEQCAGRGIPYDISCARYFCFAGSGVSGETMRRLTEAFPHAVFWPGYGMTEASPLITKPDQYFPLEKRSSVGLPGKETALMIETGDRKTREPFVRGEVVVKGPNVMLGYFENETETARVLREGWLHTGDVGYLDGDGYLYLCGRMKNVILVRGFTVYAEEVEECIMQSGLAEECVVRGEANSLGSERVCAEIVPKTPDVTPADIMAWCRGRLADYKQPRQILLTDGFRKTATGKIKRTNREAL